MSTSGPSLCLLTVAAAACSALFAIGAPSATAAPNTDDQGFVDSTARCPTVAATVAFGSTKSSRVAICRTSGGGYEYRGVRVRDGARLIVPAEADGGGFVAENDGVTYTLTASSLVVSAGSQVIRDEPMVQFHQGDAPDAPAGTPAPAAPPATPAPTTPLPPPLPAEVGGGG